MYDPKNPCDWFINENQKLKDEIFELNRRLKWIEDLSKGMLDYSSIAELIKHSG